MSNLKYPTLGSNEANVLAYLRSGHSIDVPKALALFGYTRLTSNIHRLRLKGWPILTNSFTSASGSQLTTYALDLEKVRALEGNPEAAR